MSALRIGELCAGYGGLGMGVQSVLGGELAWVSEYEPPSKSNLNPSQGAAKILAHRFPGVPNLGDMTTVDWSTVEPVDILTGGTTMPRPVGRRETARHESRHPLRPVGVHV